MANDQHDYIDFGGNSSVYRDSMDKANTDNVKQLILLTDIYENLIAS